MLAPAFTTALRILAFRAGPQDFPYSRRLAESAAGLTLLVSFLQYQLTLPPIQAALQAAASTAVFASFTWGMLYARRLPNRAAQTLSSLFLTGALLSLLLLPALSELAPIMLRIAQDPELAKTETLPAGPAMTVMLLSLWNFAVFANIFRYALDATRLGGAAAALLAALVTMTLSSAIGALAAPAAGVAT
jgi:hypothetical protein